MPPKRRSAVAAVLPLAPEIPFSPGDSHTAEEYNARKQQTTSWALNDLASSRDLAQWGNQLRSKARQWQQAFAVTAILLSIALAGLGYEVATHHAGPGTALGSSFRESFDNLSGSSQQSLQQLATRSAKLLPEGASIRDSFDKLSYNSQQALYHIVKSGVLLPSLLPHGHTAHGSSASGKSEAAELSEQLRAAEAEVRDAQTAAGSAQREVLAMQQENEMLSDLLQRSQADLSLSQDHTHELLASVSQHSDQKQVLTRQHDAVQKKLAEAIKTVELCRQSGAGILPPGSAGSKGPLDWVSKSLMGINGLLLLFFLAPGQSAESARRGTSSWLSRGFHSVQSTLFPSKKSPRKRTWAEVGAVDGLDSMGSGNLPGYALEGLASPVKKASAARCLAGKGSPARASASPRKAALISPLSAKITDADVAPVDDSSLEAQSIAEEQQQTVHALTQERDGLGRSLQAAQQELSKSEVSLADARKQMEKTQNALNSSEQQVKEITQKHTAEVQAAQQQVKEVQATLKQSAQAQADATTDKSAAETKQAELGQQLESAHQSSEQLRSSNTDLAQQLAEVRSGRTDMKADLKAVKGQLQAAQQQAGQLKEANADLTQQLEQAVSRKSAALDNLAKKKAEAAELDEEVQASHKHIESIQADLDRVTKQLQGTQQQLADSESAKDRLEQTVSGHATQISDLKEELAAATTDKDAVDVMLGKIRAEAMQKGNDLSKIKSGKENAEHTLQTSQAEAAKLARELAEVNASKAAAEADLRQKKSELKRRATELETARTEAAAARKEFKQLQATKSELETSSASKLKEVESALAATKAAKVKLDKAFKQSEANVSQLTQDLADANSGKSAAESQWQKLSQDLAEAQTENKQLDTHNAELDRKLTDASASRDSSEQALQQARTECSSLSEQLTAANSGKSDVDERLHEISETLMTAMGDYHAVKTQCSDLTQECSDLTQELQVVKTHKSTAEDALSETKGNLQQVTQQLQTNQSAFQELKSLKADLRRELIATTSQKADLEQDIRQHKSELDRVTDELKTAQKTSSRELWAARDDLAKSKRELADAHEDFDRIQGELQVSQQINEQFQATVGGLDVDGLSDVAEQIAELGTLRQKSMEVNAFQAENEDAMETLRQQHAAEIGIHRGRIQDLEQQLEARAYANELHQGEEGENADHVAQQLKDTQKQLEDAKTRMYELELRLNASQLLSASSDPLAVRKKNTLARGWNLTGYNDLRCSAFGSFVTSQTSSAHQANSAPARTPYKLSSHPVGSPEVSSHAIADDSPVPSHALQSEPSNSPASSTGSVAGPVRSAPGSPALGTPFTEPAARQSQLASHLSPFQALSGANGLRTPQSVGSFMTGGSDIASHAVQHSSSSSEHETGAESAGNTPHSNQYL